MPLQSVKLQDCWDDILPKIEEIMHDLPWKDFRKEDIYTSCANGNAAIFVDSDAPLGESFFIARIDEYESTKEKVLFLWIAYSYLKLQETLAATRSSFLPDLRLS
jgi:hypothetical protein